jgi:hypothetical protein
MRLTIEIRDIIRKTIETDKFAVASERFSLWRYMDSNETETAIALVKILSGYVDFPESDCLLLRTIKLFQPLLIKEYNRLNSDLMLTVFVVLARFSGSYDWREAYLI